MPICASAWRRSGSLLHRSAWYSKLTEYGIILSTSLAFSFLRRRAARVAVTTVCGLSPPRRTRTPWLDTPPGARSAGFGRLPWRRSVVPRSIPQRPPFPPPRPGGRVGPSPPHLPRPNPAPHPLRTPPFLPTPRAPTTAHHQPPP